MVVFTAQSLISSWGTDIVDSSKCSSLFTLLLTMCSMALFLFLLKIRRKPAVYVIDYSCAKCPDDTKTSLETMLYFLMGLGNIPDRDILFQSKVFLKSGIGEEAHIPRANLTKGRYLSMEDSYNQAHIIVVGAVDMVLKKAGISPRLIDILVVNCGLFNPTPSLSALLVNYFKMRSDVKTFHLAGMGCSASLISLGLARDLLQVHRNRARYALIASSEVIQALYVGKERPMMVTNCLFRSAGNAVVLSNRREDKKRAKMQVMHVVRVNMARHDGAHHVVEMREDEEGICGASLSPQLVKVASDALTVNIKSLAPRVLPLTELCKAGWNMAQKDVLKKKGVQPFVPNFKLAFEHFCIHPGGRAVIEGVGKGLKLSRYDIEPSAMALHRFGNTSCSGVWYILAYMEAKERLKKGDRVWQIGLGSGFKCTSAVLRVLKDLHCEPNNPWYDCVHRYPLCEDLQKQPHIASVVASLPKYFDVSTS
ncbi:hypothetical protein GOP47_0004471 [Adiantum capillus-veneris]|uniref:3-ketoacyl-CoA synthase n=1 Tax=Adiantum capillus-veneris TaxID=13818 RepID=A0A9D4V8X6_ADICA|nr:hypothetical protein GOP47_0004471 [Adiantum capillus-veneris]